MRLNLRSTPISLSIALAIGATSFSLHSHSQMLEEVLVTAQKREQGLGDVPLSIQAISGDALDKQNIFDFRGLVEQLPNVTMEVSPGPLPLSIRGVGTGAANAAAEQSVGMYVDNIYVSRGFQFNAPFTDVERVEVLKGPQGVLQGKNSVAGAVVIRSRRPTNEFEAIVRGGYEVENDGYNVEGVVSGPLSETVYGRLVAQKQFSGGWLDTNTRLAGDGVTMLQGEKDQNEAELQVIRASLVWEPTETLTLFAKIETGESERTGHHYGPSSIQPTAIVGGPAADQTLILEDFTRRDPNFDFIQNGVVSGGYPVQFNAATNLFEPYNGDFGQSFENNSATFQFDWETDIGTVTGITGYSDYERDVLLVNTMAPIDWGSGHGGGGDEFDQVTQEIRLVSPGGATIDYIVGAFYMDRTIEQPAPGNGSHIAFSALGAPAFFNFSTFSIFQEETKAFSIFGQITWNISDSFRLNAGLRHSDETKEVDHTFYTNFLVPVPSLNQIALNTFGMIPFTTADLPRSEVSDTNTDPSLSLQWDMSDDVMFYASYTEATKAGGFNSSANNPANSSFDPENATAYELGMKGTFVDGRLSASVSIFTTDYEDLQVSALDSNTNSFFFKNAAVATTEGFEADFRFAATDGLELGGAIGLADATFDDFPGASCSSAASQEADCDPVTLTRNAAGDKLRNAPELSGNLYADYRVGLGNGMEMGFRGTFLYSDDYFFAGQNDPFLQQDSYTKVDVSASLTGADGSWTVSLIGRNVTDETTHSFGGNTPLRLGSYWANVDAPREIYLNLEYRWK